MTKRIDVRDVMVVVGLAMMSAGLWFVDWRWALVIVGALIAGLAVWSARR